jgi:phosphoribosylanthranilate isomerase
MQLQYCTITGADDATEVKDLQALEKEFPFVEWAILWMPEKAGTARFPTAGWIKNFKAQCKDSPASLHLCSQALLDFAAGKKVAAMEGFTRVQLNLKFNNAGEKIDLKQLAARVKAHPEVEFILQYTEDKKDTLLPLFKDIPNHALLFDASAGAGISPDKWSAPVPGHHCGYAGGLGPENIAENLKMIEKVVPAGYATWVDMESKVRTNDTFDLGKVRRVLETAGAYVKPAQKAAGGSPSVR